MALVDMAWVNGFSVEVFFFNFTSIFSRSSTQWCILVSVTLSPSIYICQSVSVSPVSFSLCWCLSVSVSGNLSRQYVSQSVSFSLSLLVCLRQSVFFTLFLSVCPKWSVAACLSLSFNFDSLDYSRYYYGFFSGLLMISMKKNDCMATTDFGNNG